MSPQISVIIPVYNTEDYLVQCMESIINQTFTDIEIICVNDGSTDNSRNILEKFALKDKRVFVINREKASGSAALPRNIGLAQARGKYVMFLDSDDYFDVTMLEKLYYHAENMHSDLVVCDNYRISAETGEIGVQYSELNYKFIPNLKTFSYKDIPDTIFQITNTAPWHKFVLRDLLVATQLKFQLNTPILDDVFFVDALMISAKKISILKDRLVYYRAARPGAQTMSVEKHKESIYKAFYAVNEYMIEQGIYEDVKKSIQKQALYTMNWWITLVADYEVYVSLTELYRNEYFEKLNLINIEWDLPEDAIIKGFYESVMTRKHKLPIKMLLESGLKEGSNIAIYGAGTIGQNIYKVVKENNKHNIQIWCDKNADKIGNVLVKYPEELRLYNIDAVFIAIGNLQIVEEVKEYLQKLGINKEHIFWV